jgi:hypothetical protein
MMLVLIKESAEIFEIFSTTIIKEINVYCNQKIDINDKTR